MFGCVKLTSLGKWKQNKKQLKNNAKIKRRNNFYVLIFSHVGRRYKITSKGKVAAFACSVFTKTYCISVISKALNGVNVFFQASNGYLSPICKINVLERSFKSDFQPNFR